MRQNDLNEFKAVMRDAQEAVGQGERYTDGALELMFASLLEFDIGTIMQALVDHIGSKNGKWRPNASYIREQIRARTDVQWISADEAWVLVAAPPRPMLRGPNGEPDYRSTEPLPVLLNQVTAQALAAAQPFIDAGQDNAARMAFRSIYERLVEKAKVAQLPEDRVPKYFVSPGGFDDMQAVRDEGVRLGLLPAPKVEAVPLLETRRTPGAKPDLGKLLLSLNQKTMPKPEATDYE
jgi:hypothetical protein